MSSQIPINVADAYYASKDLVGGGRVGDPLAQVVACGLTSFNVGSGLEGKTIGDHLDSSAFVDRAIRGGFDRTYGDLFEKTIGGYLIVKTSLFSYDGAPCIALNDPDTGDVLLAFKTDGPENVGKNGMADFFDSALKAYYDVWKSCPGFTIRPAGAGIGGQAASYLSSVADVKASTFNAAQDWSPAWRTCRKLP